MPKGRPPEEIDDLLNGSQEITHVGQGRQEVYHWIVATLVEQGKKERGRVRALLCKLGGLSMPQITRSPNLAPRTSPRDPAATGCAGGTQPLPPRLRIVDRFGEKPDRLRAHTTLIYIR